MTGGGHLEFRHKRLKFEQSLADLVNADLYIVLKGHRFSNVFNESIKGIGKKKIRDLIKLLEKKKKREFELLYQMER